MCYLLPPCDSHEELLHAAMTKNKHNISTALLLTWQQHHSTNKSCSLMIAATSEASGAGSCPVLLHCRRSLCRCIAWGPSESNSTFGQQISCLNTRTRFLRWPVHRQKLLPFQQKAWFSASTCRSMSFTTLANASHFAQMQVPWCTEV